MADGFSGFPPAAFKFFASLAKNNNRGWYQAHKDVYEHACREPMKALMAAIDPPFGAGWMSRINNDMRFNRDRDPYKTRIEAGVKGHYVSVGAQGMYVGTGIYKPEPATLRQLREAIAADASGRKLQAIVAALRRKGYTVSTHETSSTPPRTDVRAVGALHAQGARARQEGNDGPQALPRLDQDECGCGSLDPPQAI